MVAHLPDLPGAPETDRPIIIWLDCQEVQSETNRLTMSEGTAALDLVAPGRPLFWGIECATGYITVTRDPDYLREATRVDGRREFKYVGRGTVNERDRAATVPQSLFTGRGSDALDVDLEALDAVMPMAHDQRRHFVTTTALWRRDGLDDARILYLLTDDEFAALLADA